MRPPKGFDIQENPLRHQVHYSFGLSCTDEDMNTAMCTLVRHTSDVITNTPRSIVVNPHNTFYKEDKGAACAKMSIIDRLTLSIKFNLTKEFDDDSFMALKFLWRPIFFSFNEKLSAADDDTGTTVETILAVTSDPTFEDVVPLTTNKLSVLGSSDLNQPFSTVNIAEVIGDYNMTASATMEDHVWDESLLQDALRRYTNKGALRSMMGSTRHVTLTKNRPFKNFYLDKFVPRAIRRIMPYSFFAIQVHCPTLVDMGQQYHSVAGTSDVAHLGCKILCNYHEWNSDHFQEMSGNGPPF